MSHVKGNCASVVLELIHKIYARSLVLYPGELRRDFSAEMVEVFDERMSEAYSRRGFSGLLWVWCSAMQEFVTVALPSRLAEHVVPIVAVTATLTFMMWFVGYVGYVMERACPGCGH